MKRLVVLLTVLGAACGPPPAVLVHSLRIERQLNRQASDAHKQQCTPPAQPEASLPGQKLPKVCAPLLGCLQGLGKAEQACNVALDTAKDGTAAEYRDDSLVCEAEHERAVGRCARAGISFQEK